jgi:hypothetical protein
VAEVNTSMLDVMTQSHPFLKFQKGFSSTDKHKMQGDKPNKTLLHLLSANKSK